MFERRVGQKRQNGNKKGKLLVYWVYQMEMQLNLYFILPVRVFCYDQSCYNAENKECDEKNLHYDVLLLLG